MDLGSGIGTYRTYLGIGTRISWPSCLGSNCKSDSLITFSIAGSIYASKYVWKRAIMCRKWRYANTKTSCASVPSDCIVPKHAKQKLPQDRMRWQLEAAHSALTHCLCSSAAFFHRSCQSSDGPAFLCQKTRCSSVSLRNENHNVRHACEHCNLPVQIALAQDTRKLVVYLARHGLS